jgi:Bacteriophage HK97-gp10, putative tail-component
MTMTWENHLDLEGILARVKANVEDALGEGAQVILDRSDELVPKVSGDLAATGSVKKDRGGLNTVAIVYTSVYARWIEDHLSFAHTHGGGARFLELGMIEKGEAAIQKTGEVLMGKL